MVSKKRKNYTCFRSIFEHQNKLFLELNESYFFLISSRNQHSRVLRKSSLKYAFSKQGRMGHVGDWQLVHVDTTNTCVAAMAKNFLFAVLLSLFSVYHPASTFSIMAFRLALSGRLLQMFAALAQYVNSYAIPSQKWIHIIYPMDNSISAAKERTHTKKKLSKQDWVSRYRPFSIGRITVYPTPRKNVQFCPLQYTNYIRMIIFQVWDQIWATFGFVTKKRRGEVECATSLVPELALREENRKRKKCEMRE